MDNSDKRNLTRAQRRLLIELSAPSASVLSFRYGKKGSHYYLFWTRCESELGSWRMVERRVRAGTVDSILKSHFVRDPKDRKPYPSMFLLAAKDKTP